MSKISLYWHDYETFGANPRWDRPAQFAGVRTDENLDPIGEPLVVYCQPATDMLPAPEACLITGITPQKAREHGVPEARFIAAIHRELIYPGTCGVGYNSLRFDDEVTRNCLYRNFHDAYEREWRNGNSRWDLIDMVRLTRALRPDGIEWPVDDQGRPSFRLELLTAANGIEQVGAHDALVDVYASIELARLVRQRQPRLYDFVWRNRSKHEVAASLQLGAWRPVLHVSEKYPAEKGCIAPVVAVARHPRNQNGIVVYDLRVDPTPMLDLSAKEIGARIFTPVADLPQGTERIPLKTVHLNKCPIIVPMNAMRPADAERLEIDSARCDAHLQRLKAVAGLAGKLEEVFSALPPEIPGDDDPDLMLYKGGFFSDADKHRMARLREINPEQLARFRGEFDDPRLAEMLFRYRARNFPMTLTEDEKRRWEMFRRSRLTEKGGAGGLTLHEYEAKLDQLEAQPYRTGRDREILSSLRAWGREISG